MKCFDNATPFAAHQFDEIKNNHESEEPGPQIHGGWNRTATGIKNFLDLGIEVSSRSHGDFPKQEIVGTVIAQLIFFAIEADFGEGA